MDDYPQAEAKESEGPIRNALTMCEAVLDELNKEIEELARRIQPALSPVNPQVDGQTLESPRVEGSPLQNRLNDFEDHLRAAVKHLGRISQRMAL